MYSQEKMLPVDKTLRYLAPIEFDRVKELFDRYPCECPNVTTHLQVVKIFKDPIKFIDILEKLETHIIRKAGFNIVIRNVPKFAQLRETYEIVKIGSEELRDTLEQFGAVKNIEFIGGVVYAKFEEDATPCHRVINNMQIGQNIITTKLC
jgi:hypothetical protein